MLDKLGEGLKEKGVDAVKDIASSVLEGDVSLESIKEKGIDAVTDAAGSVMGGGDSEEVAEEE